MRSPPTSPGALALLVALGGCGAPPPPPVEAPPRVHTSLQAAVALGARHPDAECDLTGAELHLPCEIGGRQLYVPGEGLWVGRWTNLDVVPETVGPEVVLEGRAVRRGVLTIRGIEGQIEETLEPGPHTLRYAIPEGRQHQAMPLRLRYALDTGEELVDDLERGFELTRVRFPEGAAPGTSTAVVQDGLDLAVGDTWGFLVRAEPGLHTLRFEAGPSPAGLEVRAGRFDVPARVVHQAAPGTLAKPSEVAVDVVVPEGEPLIVVLRAHAPAAAERPPLPLRHFEIDAALASTPTPGVELEGGPAEDRPWIVRTPHWRIELQWKPGITQVHDASDPAPRPKNHAHRRPELVLAAATLVHEHEAR